MNVKKMVKDMIEKGINETAEGMADTIYIW